MLIIIPKKKSLLSPQVITPNYSIPVDGFVTTYTLPTSEPSTGAPGSFVITVQPSDLVTYNGSITGINTALMVCAGKNNNAISANLSYRILKNGSSKQNNTVSITAGNYWTVDTFLFYNNQVGDNLEIRVWATGGGFDFRYNGYRNVHTRWKPGQDKQIFANTTFTFAKATFANGALNGTDNFNVPTGNGNTFTGPGAGTYGPMALRQDPTYGIFYLMHGDSYQISNLYQNASIIPWYDVILILTSLSFTPTTIKGN